jgi:hypothetical protein
MNTNSYLTAAVATQVINSRVREAKAHRLAVEARGSSRIRQSRPAGMRTRVPRLSRPATA